MTNSEINHLSLVELKELRRKITFAIEDRLGAVVNELSVGSKVTINHRKASGTWTIRKINRKTVIVEQGERRVKSSLALLAAV
tara:strand:- start:101 stop:349 length:249 start_codon:yes stop_codon:yes gene_type:complete